MSPDILIITPAELAKLTATIRSADTAMRELVNSRNTPHTDLAFQPLAHQYYMEVASA